jgi:hypothetical protein
MSVTQVYDTYNGCIPYDKDPGTVILTGGAEADVVYQIRNSRGEPVDLSSFFSDPNDILAVRFCYADNSRISVAEMTGEVIEAATGKVKFTLPKVIYDHSCIYFFYFSIREQITLPDGSITYSDVKKAIPGRGILLIEWSPWMDPDQHCVPAIQDIRRKLDDFVSKNDLLNQYEFTTDDIVHAIARPVHIWNETPPDLRRYRYTIGNFPYYDYWIIGVVGELMEIASIHYMRNKLQSNHGGISGDEKNRDQQYLMYAQKYKKEFLDFVIAKKRESNNQGFGVIHSRYIRLR